VTYEKKVLMTIDMTPAIKIPITYFNVTESALSTAKSVLMGAKAISSIVSVTRLSCDSTIARTKASACFL